MDKVKVSLILKVPQDMPYDRLEKLVEEAVIDGLPHNSGITFVSCSFEEDLEE